VSVISYDSTSDLQRYPVAIAGKVGEFLQGVTRDGSPILYSATIGSPKLTTRALGLPASSFRVLREDQPDRSAEKTVWAIRSLLARSRVEQPWHFEVRIRNSSPSAKELFKRISKVMMLRLQRARLCILADRVEGEPERRDS
jgi:hypothetical protein